MNTAITFNAQQQSIEHVFPNGFSFLQLATGRSNAQNDQKWLQSVGSVHVSPVSIASAVSPQVTIQHNSGSSLQTTDLLGYLASALNGNPLQPDPTVPFSLGILPLPVYPGDLDHLNNVTADNVEHLDSQTVHIRLEVSYGASSSDYHVYLIRHQGRYILVVSHSAIDYNAPEFLNSLIPQHSESRTTPHSLSDICRDDFRHGLIRLIITIADRNKPCSW